jgi:lipopolysaccharide heptosyltransferase II
LRLPFSLLDALNRPFTRKAWRQPAKIVLIKPCCIGDVIMTTPLLEVLHQNYPDSTITYVTGSWSKSIAEHNPAVDAIIDCGTVGIPGRYRFKAYLQLAQQMRLHRFDLALVLDRSPMLTLLPWLAGIPRRVGPDSLGRGFSLTDRVPVSASPTELQHQAEIYLDLARALRLRIDHPHMLFTPTQAEQQAAQALIAETIGDQASTKKLVAVFPGGGSNPGMQLTAKRWPLDHYRELVEQLVTVANVCVLLIGGSDDAELNARLIEGLSNGRADVFNLAGKTSFGESAALIQACTLFIGNDSSPMHLAAAVGTPVIAIFGPTSPQEYGPYPLDDPQHVSIWHNPKGRPCFFLGKMQPCEDCTCMQTVTVDEVWQAVQQIRASEVDREGAQP